MDRLRLIELAYGFQAWMTPEGKSLAVIDSDELLPKLQMIVKAAEDDLRAQLAKEPPAVPVSDEREAFENWLADKQMLDATWQPERNCYAEFPSHLAFKAFQFGRQLSAPPALDHSEDVLHMVDHSEDKLDMVPPAQAMSEPPVFVYFKEPHEGWPEYNRLDEFSDGSTGGEPLVKLSDVRALSRPAIPEGWKMVPIIPTREMIDAAYAAELDIYFGYQADGRPGGAGDVYQFMIAASPSAQKETGKTAAPLVDIPAASGGDDSLDRRLMSQTGKDI